MLRNKLTEVIFCEGPQLNETGCEHREFLMGRSILSIEDLLLHIVPSVEQGNLPEVIAFQ